MPLSTNINNYADVRAILDQVLPVGFGVYTLDTPGKARNWQMRAYQFRRLEQEAMRKAANVKGYTPQTPYDMMRLTLKDKSVEIDFAPQPTGKLTVGGKTIQPAPPKAAPIIQTISPSTGLSFAPLNDLEIAARKLAEDEGED